MVLCQLFNGLFIDIVSSTLVQYRSVPVQVEVLECMQDVVGCALLYARLIQVIDTQKPLTAMCPGIEIAANGGNQGPEMKRAGRCRSKPADVFGCCHGYNGFPPDSLASLM